MKICVFGAGAVGGYLAARLAHAGRNVSVIARGPHLEAIRSRGLALESANERFVVHPAASGDPAALGPQDLVIVATKAPALPEIARRIGPLLHGDTTVAFAMNGVQWWYGHGFAPRGRPLDLGRVDPGGAMARAVGPERALGMIVHSPNEVAEPGVVRNHRPSNRFVLGDPAGPVSNRVRRAEAALSGAGFEVEVADDIRRAMWRKLVQNVGMGPACALTGARSAELVEEPAMRAVARALIVEAIAVAAAHGFALDVDPDALTRPSNRPMRKPSMLQDVERGRPMEIDAMVGIVEDFAKDAGVPTPTLSTVLALLALRARVAGLYP